MPRRRRRIPPLERRAQQRGNEPRLYPRQPAQRRQPQAYSQPDGNPARPPAPSNRPSCPPLSHISASPGHSPTRHAAIPDEPQASYSTGIETQPLPNPLPECPVQPDPQIKSPEPPDQPHHNCPQQNPCPDPNGSHEQPQTSNASPSQPPKHSKYTQDPEHPSPSEKSSQKNYQKNKFGPAGYSGGCGCIFTCTGVFPQWGSFSWRVRPGSARIGPRLRAAGAGRLTAAASTTSPRARPPRPPRPPCARPPAGPGPAGVGPAPRPPRAGRSPRTGTGRGSRSLRPCMACRTGSTAPVRWPSSPTLPPPPLLPHRLPLPPPSVRIDFALSVNTTSCGLLVLWRLLLRAPLEPRGHFARDCRIAQLGPVGLVVVILAIQRSLQCGDNERTCRGGVLDHPLIQPLVQLVRHSDCNRRHHSLLSYNASPVCKTKPIPASGCLTARYPRRGLLLPVCGYLSRPLVRALGVRFDEPVSDGLLVLVGLLRAYRRLLWIALGSGVDGFERSICGDLELDGLDWFGLAEAPAFETVKQAFEALIG